MKAYAILALLAGITLGLVNTAEAQVVELWQSRYNGPGNSDDVVTDMAVDANGDVYVTGYSTGNGTGQDYCTIKYTAPGDTQWVARYNVGMYDRSWGLVVDENYNVFVTGGTHLGARTIKYNSLGVQQWVAANNLLGTGGRCIVLDASGNVYIAGDSDPNMGGDYDYLIVKYNSAGIQQWQAFYNGPGNGVDEPASLAVDANGNVYVTGWSEGTNGYYDYCTIKYNSAGVQQWVSRYNGPGNSADVAHDLIIDASGTYVYVTGASVGIGTGLDYCTIKYNSAGVQQWVSRYNGPGNGDDIAYDMIWDPVYSIFLHITGSSGGSGTGTDFASLKYDTNGGQQWALRYNRSGSSSDNAYKMAADNEGNIYVTGGTVTQALTDYTTVKYAANGSQQWVMIYNNAMNNGIDMPVDLAVDGSKNVYVSGYSNWNTLLPTNYDYLTIQYRQGPDLELDVEVLPVNPPITVPANGGSFQFNAFVQRRLPPQAPFMVWTRDKYPNGTYTAPLMGPVTINPPVMSSLTRLRMQNVPSTWPAGVHTYLGYANTTFTYPANDSDHFTWTKSAVADGADWWDFSCTGESFPGEEIFGSQPSAFSLQQARPNPFNPTTAISYTLQATSHVSLKIYDTAGKLVSVLTDGWRETGTYQVTFNGSGLASGIYLAKLTAGENTATQKLVLLK